MILVLVLAFVLMAGCGQVTPTPSTAPGSPTIQAAPTLPAPTAPPTASPSPAPLTEAALVASLQKSGLPVVDLVAYTPETDPNKLLGRPNQYVVKVSWTDQRAPELNPFSSKPTVEVFTTTAALAAWKGYIEALAAGGPLFAQYVYVNDARMALCRVPRDLTPEAAREYERWFAAL